MKYTWQPDDLDLVEAPILTEAKVLSLVEERILPVLRRIVERFPEGYTKAEVDELIREAITPLKEEVVDLKAITPLKEEVVDLITESNPEGINQYTAAGHSESGKGVATHEGVYAPHYHDDSGIARPGDHHVKSVKPHFHRVRK